MADRKSLADRAVEALAAASAMDAGVTIDTPGRHVIWSLKRQAEQSLSEAFDRAISLARTAQDLREQPTSHSAGVSDE